MRSFCFGLCLCYSRIESFLELDDMAGIAHDPVESYSAYAEVLIYDELKNRQREGYPSRGCKEDQQVGSLYNVEGGFPLSPLTNTRRDFWPSLLSPRFEIRLWILNGLWR